MMRGSLAMSGVPYPQSLQCRRSKGGNRPFAFFVDSESFALRKALNDMKGGVRR
jgi:hypothetical protein